MVLVGFSNVFFLGGVGGVLLGSGKEKVIKSFFFVVFGILRLLLLIK